jgi:glycosyltransferase involved in cell wall biosynthesis
VKPEHEFVAMLRIRNEARWIEEVIESLLPLCARIFILDDHSTDETASICARYESVEVFPSPFTGLNEARDKNWLFDQVMERCKPTWILCIDGDEVLSPGSAEVIREKTRAAECDAFSFKIVFLWNDRHTARVDRIYDHFWRPSMFRPFHPDPNKPDHAKIAGDLRWLTTPFGRVVNGETPNLHCSSVPQRYLAGQQRCEGVSLLHYGYMDRADRVRKLDYYTGIDWLNQAEDSYRHMTQGDGVTIEELPITRRLIAEGRMSASDAHYMIDTPPTASLIHAGPLELRAL